MASVPYDSQGREMTEDGRHKTDAGDYTAQESLADQSGANGVLTFTFSSAVTLVIVTSQGASLVARATATATDTPSATRGQPCFDGSPAYLPVKTSTVLVYAPAGTTISVIGLRRV